MFVKTFTGDRGKKKVGTLVNTLTINNVDEQDSALYLCEVMVGINDKVTEVKVRLEDTSTRELTGVEGAVLTKYEGNHGVNCAANLSVHSHVIFYFKPLSAPLCSAIWL